MSTGAPLVLLALALLPGCRRVDHEAIARAKADLVGAWLRVPESEERSSPEGFDLRADGGVGLFGSGALAGGAWNRVRDELVISVQGERDPQPRSTRLEIAALDGDQLALRPGDDDRLAGRYRRSPVEHVTGVVTYLERIALPGDARVEVRLTCGGEPAALARIAPRASVPIPFALSVLPAADAGARECALEAAIQAGATRLFATPAPVAVERGASDVELIVRPAHAPG